MAKNRSRPQDHQSLFVSFLRIPVHSQFKRCALTDRDLADILGRTNLDVETFYFLDFLLGSKFPDFQIPRNPARARLGPGWAGLGPGGPLGWAGRVFWVGRVVRGNCELICFLKDCLYAQALEEPEKVKCCTCGELKLVSDMKMVQSEDIINGWKNQARCRDCTNLRPRLARLIKPGSEVVRGYEELTAKGRTFVPSIHVAYMLTLCCKRFKIQIRSAQKCRQGLDQ